MAGVRSGVFAGPMPLCLPKISAAVGMGNQECGLPLRDLRCRWPERRCPVAQPSETLLGRSTGARYRSPSQADRPSTEWNLPPSRTSSSGEVRDRRYQAVHPARPGHPRTRGLLRAVLRLQPRQHRHSGIGLATCTDASGHAEPDGSCHSGARRHHTRQTLDVEGSESAGMPETVPTDDVGVKRLCLVLDTNQWLSHLMLRSATAAAVLYSLRQQGGVLGLPYVVEEELKLHAVSEGQKAAKGFCRGSTAYVVSWAQPPHLFSQPTVILSAPLRCD